MKEVIQSEKAPPAIGPYSQALSWGNLLFLSGQIALDSKGELHNRSLSEEVHQIFANIRAVLAVKGLDLNSVLKVTVYLKSMDDFLEVNEIYKGFFSEPFPARACVAVAGLPKNVRVEIDIIAGNPSH